MARQAPSAILNQAQMAAQVKYGPEESGLRGLAAQALYDLTSGVQIQHGMRVGIQNAVQALRPTMTQTYAQATGQVNDAANQLNTDLSTLGSSADPYKAAAAKEQFMARARIAGAMTDALKQLDDRSVQAGQGEQFAVTNLQNKYGQDMTRIQDRLQSLQGEKGSYVAAQYGQGLADEQKRQDTLSNQAADRASRESISSAGRSQQWALAQYNQGQQNQRQQKQIDSRPPRAAPGARTPAANNTYDDHFRNAFSWLWNQRNSDPNGFPFGPNQQPNNVAAAARKATGAAYGPALAATNAFLKKFPINRQPTANLR